MEIGSKGWLVYKGYYPAAVEFLGYEATDTSYPNLYFRLLEDAYVFGDLIEQQNIIAEWDTDNHPVVLHPDLDTAITEAIGSWYDFINRAGFNEHAVQQIEELQKRLESEKSKLCV